MSDCTARLTDRGEPELAQFVQTVRDLNGPVVLGPGSRIEGGQRLFGSFDSAVRSYSENASIGTAQIGEFVNEMAVACALADDATLSGPISYEPDFLPSGRRIDFAATGGQGAVFIEVKTIRPRSPDTEQKWDQYRNRIECHTGGTQFVVQKEWMGASIYADAFSARSKFLQYAIDFEERLAEALKARNGHGILVFCGTGFEWSLDQLEDFADFYFTGDHRQDDTFADMETHHLTGKGISLQRNISGFAYLERAWTSPAKRKLRCQVRGPKQFGMKV